MEIDIQPTEPQVGLAAVVGLPDTSGNILAFAGLTREIFDVLDRPSLKYAASDVATGDAFKAHQANWNLLVSALKQALGLDDWHAQVAGWQNSGNLTGYFWVHLRLDKQYATGVSVSLYRDSLNVRLEFRAKDETSRIDLPTYNGFVAALTESDFMPGLASSLEIWPSDTDFKHDNRAPLSDFLSRPDVRASFLQRVQTAKGKWLQLGRIYSIEEVLALGPDLISELATVVRSLRPLYERTLRLAPPPQRFWKISPGEDAKSWREFRDQSVVTIDWNGVGDVSRLASPEEFLDHVRRDLPPSDAWKPKHSYIATQHYRMAREINEGDWIVVYNNGRLLAIGEAVGPYLHRVVNVAGNHQRRVSWLKFFEPPVDIRNDPAFYKEASGYETIIPLVDPASIAAVRALMSLAPPTVSRTMSLPTNLGACEFYDFVERRGYRFPPEVLTNYALALATKPFVILTGISGTGKTKIAQLFAEYMCPDEPQRYAFVAVRPDWMDNRGLLGYFNPLSGEYVPTDFLKLLLRATAEPERPFFVILDEMNLAKVEHYFSDFLSCLETRRLGRDGQLEQEKLALHQHPSPIEIVDEGVARVVPQSLAVSANVYFTGTVNVDETTYMFSPKVLDRANTIEFNHVDLVAYGRPAVTAINGLLFKLGEDFALGACGLATKEDYDQLPEAAKRTLEALHEILGQGNMHFGFRIANEAARYLRLAEQATGDGTRELALDLQILQKILPKLHGSRAKLESTLLELLRYLTVGAFDGAQTTADWYKACESGLRLADTTVLSLDGVPARFPRSAAKVWRMLRMARSQGFASFIT